MGYGIAFHGTYEYEDVDAAERAVSAARENLAFEAGEPDADLAESVRSTFNEMIVINGASIRVQVDEYGPPGLYPIYEMIDRMRSWTRALSATEVLTAAAR